MPIMLYPETTRRLIAAITGPTPKSGSNTVGAVAKGQWPSAHRRTTAGRRRHGAVSGRRLTGSPKNTLEIGAWRRRAWPGNATPELRRDYALFPNYVIYRSRGCWRVRLGADETTIAVEIK